LTSFRPEGGAILGRHEHQSDEDDEVSVDATLELELDTVEQAIEAYLKDPSVDLRNELLIALGRLDQQIDRSDAYEGSRYRAPRRGGSTNGARYRDAAHQTLTA